MKDVQGKARNKRKAKRKRESKRASDVRRVDGINSRNVAKEMRMVNGIGRRARDEVIKKVRELMGHKCSYASRCDCEISRV